jgi:hypothetical protein
MKPYRVDEEHLDCSMELFMMTYMDLNHIAPIHRGLNSWVNARKAKFEFGRGLSVQWLPFNPNPNKCGAYLPYYLAWMDYAGKDPEFGAEWTCVYPYEMSENYPGLTVTSSLKHHCGGIKNTLRFFGMTESDRLTEAAIAAYLETAAEDTVATENIQWDWDYNAPVGGTFHPILQSGVKHWKDWMAAR